MMVGAIVQREMNAFTALADPTRRRLVELLLDGERPAGDLAAQFDLSGAAVSQHLKVLREARIVRVRRDAQRRIYSIDGTGLAEVDAWLQRTKVFWSAALDDLERALTESSPPTRTKEPPR